VQRFPWQPPLGRPAGSRAVRGPAWKVAASFRTRHRCRVASGAAALTTAEGKAGRSPVIVVDGLAPLPEIRVYGCGRDGPVTGYGRALTRGQENAQNGKSTIGAVRIRVQRRRREICSMLL